MAQSDLKYRDLIYILFSELELIQHLFGSNTNYEKLLRELTNYEMSTEKPFPYQKDLLKNLGYSRSELMSLMNELYDEFREKLSQPQGYPIYETEVWFLVKTEHDYWVVGIDNLEVLPRVGEKFLIPFVRGQIGSAFGTVEDIEHQFDMGKHIINISMNGKIE